jgi:hypothetical protein
MTARKADAQMQPLAADAQAVLAALDGGRHLSNQDLIEMAADVFHRAFDRLSDQQPSNLRRRRIDPSAVNERRSRRTQFT